MEPKSTPRASQDAPGARLASEAGSRLFFGVDFAVFLIVFNVLLMPPELPAASVFVMLFFKFFVASTSAGLLLFAVRAKWRPRRSHRKKQRILMMFQGTLSQRRRDKEGKMQRNSGKTNIIFYALFC